MSDLVPLNFKVDPELIKALDSARGRVNRSLFIRQAIAEKLSSLGVTIDEDLIFPPDRATILQETEKPADVPASSKKKVSYKEDHAPNRPGGRDRRSDTPKKSAKS